MLTLDLINAQEALKGLTDEQKQTIATLSQNDENSVIGTRIGEIYREMDSTIEKATGIPRDGAEKTYKYLERAANAYADKYKDYDSLKQTIATLTTEKNELQAKIAKGGDEAVRAELESVKRELASTKETYTNLKSTYDTEKAKHESEILGIRIDGEISRANEGLKFKGGFSEAALNTLKAQAVAKVKAMNPSYEGDRLIFHKDGVVMNNPDNALNPYTAQELLIREYKEMDILEDKKKGGAGGNGNLPNPKNLIGASTQTEATDNITKELLSQGLLKGSSEFQEAFSKRWEEADVAKLPLQ